MIYLIYVIYSEVNSYQICGLHRGRHRFHLLFSYVIQVQCNYSLTLNGTLMEDCCKCRFKIANCGNKSYEMWLLFSLLLNVSETAPAARSPQLILSPRNWDTIFLEEDPGSFRIISPLIRGLKYIFRQIYSFELHFKGQVNTCAIFFQKQSTEF